MRRENRELRASERREQAFPLGANFYVISPRQKKEFRLAPLVLFNTNGRVWRNDMNRYCGMDTAVVTTL